MYINPAVMPTLILRYGNMVERDEMGIRSTGTIQDQTLEENPATAMLSKYKHVFVKHYISSTFDWGNKM